MGNILSLQHIGDIVGSYTRDYNYSTGNSRLNSTDVGATNYPYTYDNRGNMLTMPHLSAMVWNPLNELQKTTRGTTDTYFNYSGGERIRKVAEKSGGIVEQRIYLGSYEIYRKFVSGSLTLERTTVHISDDTGRIAMLEVRTVGSDSAPASLQRYIYSNHLQSASLELDENADIISYEEYHPFGTTAYQASNTSINAVAKRYRYTGKERDEETGLYYHGARYYIPWLARWSASDPKQSEMPTWSSYNYGFCNPITWQDSTGMAPNEPEGGSMAGVKVNSEGFYEAQPTIIRPGDKKASEKQELIAISPGRSQNTVDNAVDVRGQDLGKKFETVQAAAKQQAQASWDQFRMNAFLDQRIIGADRDGNSYNVSRREMAESARRENEQFGEMVRSGGIGVGIGYALGGKEGAKTGYVIDGVMMSFAGVGTPYGKVEPIRPTEIPFAPPIENPVNQARFSNEAVRTWYDIRVNSINTNIPFTESNAKALTEQRNNLKIEARSMMANRALAAELDITAPVKPFEFYKNKYSKEGFSGPDLWQRIIQGSTTPNKSVNQQLGVKIYYYGK